LTSILIREFIFFRGFQLPFLVMGGIEFLVFVIAFFTFPDAHSIPPDTDLPVVRTLPMMNLLKVMIT